MKVAIVVAVFNRLELTKRFIKSIKENSGYDNYQIVIIDDNSIDGTKDYLKSNHPEIKVLEGNGDLWWTGGTNLGVQYALDNKFDYVLTINNDAIVKPNYLFSMIETSKQYPNAIIGNTILKSNSEKVWAIGLRKYWDEGVMFYRNFDDFDINWLKTKISNPFEVDALHGDGVLIPIKVFQKIGLYNQRFTPHYHADSEFTLRAKKHGIKSYVSLDAQLFNEPPENTKLVKNFYNFIFNKKSDAFLPSLFYSYWKYANGVKKLYFIKHYFHYFRQTDFYQGMKRKIRG